MPSPIIVGGVPTGRYVEAKQATPTSTVSANAATWRGRSMNQPRSFPLLQGSSFGCNASLRCNLLTGPLPSVAGVRGTFDVWFRMGSGADSIVMAHSVESTATAPVINVAVGATGKATGLIQDAGGATQAAWTAASMAANAAGALVHMQMAWDSSEAISGLYHVKVIVNDVVMPVTDFTTAPLTSWTPFQPAYLSTGVFTESGFDGEMILTQASLKVVI